MSLPGREKVSAHGEKGVYMTSEEALRHSGIKKRKAVVTNEAEKGDGTKETKTAVFSFNGAGDWVNGIKKDLGRRFGNAKVVMTEKEDSDDKNPFKSITKMPMNLVSEQVKGQAKQNAGKIAVAIVELGLYSAAFHHTKEGLKHITRNRKYTGPTVRYVSDVMMPDGNLLPPASNYITTGCMYSQ